MRLIDISKIKPMDFQSCEMDGLDVVRYLNTLPTIDAAPVVRCKDCARCVTHKGVPICNKWRTFPEVELDGFCSCGERKEGAENA